jgi:hypothetical protein
VDELAVPSAEAISGADAGVPSWLTEPFCALPEENSATWPEVRGARPSTEPAGEPPTASARGAERPADLWAELEGRATPLTVGALTAERVQEEARKRIRAGAELAARGAYFTAQGELVAALRMLTRSSDQRLGVSRHTAALASGMRALDEAADFVPRGRALDADVNVAVIAASHQTELAKHASQLPTLPSEAADRYYAYAQQQLGASVAGSPAGSMALHFLGKLNRQLGRLESDRLADASRRAFALQQAALLARADNDLAAHELAVLMAEAGYDPAAEDLLQQVARRQPHPIVFRNLASVQMRLGKRDAAAGSRDEARRLAAAQGGDGRVAWLPPDAFARTGDAATEGSPTGPSAPPPSTANGAWAAPPRIRR